jgi:hypothetical protein
VTFLQFFVTVHAIKAVFHFSHCAWDFEMIAMDRSMVFVETQDGEIL